VKSRLTKDGGTVSVSVHARPALRLVFTDGDRITITGRGVAVQLPALNAPAKHDVLGKLDGFTDVDIRFSQVRADPLTVDRFTLTRLGGSKPYRLTMSGTTSADAIGSYVAGPLGALGAQFVLPDAGGQIPLQADYELRSDHGRPVVVGGGGQVAGIPIGPLGAALASAILDRV
jgi:hypothetical protein